MNFLNYMIIIPKVINKQKTQQMIIYHSRKYLFYSIISHSFISYNKYNNKILKSMIKSGKEKKVFYSDILGNI